MATDQPAEPPRTWGLGDVWITLALYLLLAVVAGSIVLAVADGPTQRAWGVLLVLTLPWLGLAGWPLATTASKGRGPVRDLRLVGGWREVGVGVAGGMAALVLAVVAATLTESLLGRPVESSVGDLANDLADASPWPVVVLAALTAFGAPVVEEIAFRGLLYGALEKRGLRPVVCVLLSGLIFAVFHLEPVRIPLLLVLGIVLGAVRAATGSTLASIATHMTINVVGAIGILTLALG